jgi:hypothetical protein
MSNTFVVSVEVEEAYVYKWGSPDTRQEETRTRTIKLYTQTIENLDVGAVARFINSPQAKQVIVQSKDFDETDR